MSDQNKSGHIDRVAIGQGSTVSVCNFILLKFSSIFRSTTREILGAIGRGEEAGFTRGIRGKWEGKNFILIMYCSNSPYASDIKQI